MLLKNLLKIHRESQALSIMLTVIFVTLAYLASMNNDRYKNDFPKYNGSDRGWQQTDKEFLQKAQDLLTKYGEMMVKKGLLSP